MALGGAMAKPRDDRQKDLLRPALEAIIDLGHPLARLAREINWGFLDRRLPGSARRGQVGRACRRGLWRGC
jgi:transposase, IS5 family